MTLWTWVAQAAQELRDGGQGELADAVVRMPQLAAEGDTARIASTVAKLGGAARGMGGPTWMGAFLAHWPIAARVGDRAEGETVLPEAMARLWAAHAPHGEGAGCPPAACAAENVLNCYANIDGPGYVVDRATLLTESLVHTRPGTPAWEALASTRADILVDDERPDEAVAVLEVRAAEARAAGTAVSFDYGFGYVRALRHQYRHTEALKALDRLEAMGLNTWPPGIPRANAHRRIRFERARLLAWLARAGERAGSAALAALPDVREAEAHPALRRAWAEAAENLAAEGTLPNDWRLGVTLTAWSRYCERVGSHRPCLELSLSAARLAAARGARWVADGAVRRARRSLSRIRRGDELAADLKEARGMVAAVPSLHLPTSPEVLLDLLRKEPPDQVDPERQADLLIAALIQRPGDAPLLNALGHVGRTLVLTDSAAEAQWQHIRRVPGDQKAALALLETLLHDNDTAGVRALVRTLTSAALVRSGG